jgi:hypothetical protein
MPEGPANGKNCPAPPIPFSAGHEFEMARHLAETGYSFQFPPFRDSLRNIIYEQNRKQYLTEEGIMKSVAVKFVILFVAALALGACRSAPIYNVQSATMATPADATLEQVAGAIKRAGAGLGWQMIDKGPGEIEGRLHLRSHVAVVSITFDKKQFSIFYKDSSNLDYDGTRIHKNYNGWVQNLEQAILAQTAGL